MGNQTIIKVFLVTVVAVLSIGSVWALLQEPTPQSRQLFQVIPDNSAVPVPVATAKPTPTPAPTATADRVPSAIQLEMPISQLPVGSVIRFQKDQILEPGIMSYGMLGDKLGYIFVHEAVTNNEQRILLRDSRLTLIEPPVIMSNKDSPMTGCILRLKTDGGFTFSVKISAGTKLYVTKTNEEYAVYGSNFKIPTLGECNGFFEALMVPGPRIIKF